LELNHNSRQVATPRISQKFSKKLWLESKDRYFMASYSCPVLTYNLKNQLIKDSRQAEAWKVGF